jgi:soluble lytic murein transglycosylase-like protein
MSRIPYRVGQWLPQAKAAGAMFGVDPLDLLAICDRESNGDPNAQSPDGGLGLFQITRKFHPTFCDMVGPDGVPAWRVPAWNAMYAAALLQHNVKLFDGVIDEPLLAAIASYNASDRRVREKLRELSRPITREQIIHALDPLTTGGDYLSDVLSRRNSYVLAP